jgi:hypothetical protein
MLSLQERYTDKRKAYMVGKMSHFEFYVWLAKAIGVTENDLPFSLSEIASALPSDKSLNNLPLAMWDKQNCLIQRKAFSKGLKVWSLCDTVCTLKNYAQFLIGCN